MNSLLQRLGQALCTTDPELNRRLLAGADESALAGAELAVDHAFPSALRRLYLWRDGQRGKGTFPAGAGLGKGFFLPVGRALVRRETLLAGGRWSPAWWPLVDGGDGDLLAVELAGKPPRVGEDTSGGEIVFFRHESPGPLRPFASLEDWLKDIVSRLEASSQATTPSVGELAGALGRPLTEAADWAALRAWLRALAESASTATFARLALAVEPSPPTGHEHPAFATLRTALATWLDQPDEIHRDTLREALASRARTFIPRPQLRPILQHAAEAALAESPTRACDQALHALAQAEPGLADGSLGVAEAKERCQALQREILAILAS